jgi:hypothetical protein
MRVCLVLFTAFLVLFYTAEAALGLVGVEGVCKPSIAVERFLDAAIPADETIIGTFSAIGCIGAGKDYKWINDLLSCSFPSAENCKCLLPFCLNEAH